MASPRILVVCTGNVCRSPALEMMLKSSVLGPSWPELGVDVVSAGTAALAGQPMELTMQQCLDEIGVEVDTEFRARQMTPAMVEASALIVTATRYHRAEVFRLVPSALRRTFTISELAGRARTWTPQGSTPAERLPALTESAAKRRSTPLFRRATDEDVVDPYGRSRRVHRRAAAQLFSAAADLTRALQS